MKLTIYLPLVLIGALLLVGCGEDRSTDVAQTRVPRPELTIGEVDYSNRSLAITVSNPTDTAMIISGSEDRSVYGAYWFVGEEVLEVPGCGTGFWDNAITIAPNEVKRLSVALPRPETNPPSTLTLAIVYAGHGAVTREELPRMSDDDPRINLLRHPDALIGCRKVEAAVSLEETTEAEQGADDRSATPVPSKAE